jgi:hypothetical protein
MTRRSAKNTIPDLRPISSEARNKLTERFVTALCVRRAYRRVWDETQEFFVEHWSAQNAVSIGAVRDCMNHLEDAIYDKDRRYKIQDAARRIGLEWSEVLAAMADLNVESEP